MKWVVEIMIKGYQIQGGVKFEGFFKQSELFLGKPKLFSLSF